MGLYYASLNSGSNGNCYYAGTDNAAVLIDVGIHCKEIEKRLHHLQLSIEKIKGIFITHEHTDHIRGLVSFSSKYQIPVYLSPGTFNHAAFELRRITYNCFTDESPIQLEDLTIKPFKKIHDAANPYSFLVHHDEMTLGVITDIGIACDNVVHHFGQCHAAILESNYDMEMLKNGRYPYHLKQRITGGKGHISNHEAVQLFTRHGNKNLSHLILGHLSAENNNPQLVKDLFASNNSRGIRIDVASRYHASELYCLKKENDGIAINEEANAQLKLF